MTTREEVFKEFWEKNRAKIGNQRTWSKNKNTAWKKIAGWEKSDKKEEDEEWATEQQNEEEAFQEIWVDYGRDEVIEGYARKEFAKTSDERYWSESESEQEGKGSEGVEAEWESD